MGNLTEIFALLDEVVAGSDTFIGLVILSVKITITVAIGVLVVGLFAKITKKI